MTMDTKNTPNGTEADILFSRTVKAGQRVYYIDVKKNKRGDNYLSITESKKMISGMQDSQHVSFEKHKIFLFPEDFEKFKESMTEAMTFAQSNHEAEPRKEEENGEINIDMDFSTEL